MREPHGRTRPRLVTLSVLGSLGAHVLALLIPIPTLAPTAAPDAGPVDDVLSSEPRLLRLRPRDERGATWSPERRAEEARPVDVPTPTAERPETLPGADPGVSTSGADALRPSLRDARLWSEDPSRIGAPSGWSVERFFLAQALAEAERRRASSARAVAGMSEWSRGRDRGRWGVSPGRLHLGPTTVPFCGGGGSVAAECGFGLLPHRRQDFAEWSERYAEIRRQAVLFEADSILDARARAIRARRDAARPDTLPPGAG